jgi:hypothetical protein
MQRRGLTYALLFAVAVAMGVAASGLPRLHRDAPLPAAPDVTTTTTTTSTTTTSSATASTAAVTHPRAAVRVLIANASAVNGAAAKRSSTLSAAGYDVLTPVNTAPAATSEVFFSRAADGDARAIAATLGIGDGDVHPMPAKPPVANANITDVVVVIGRDLGARSPTDR